MQFISSHQLVQPRIQALGALNSQKLQIKQKHHRQRRIGRSVINNELKRKRCVCPILVEGNSHGSSGIKNRTPCFVVFVGNFPRMQTLTWATENSIRATRISNCLPEGQVHFFLFREPCIHVHLQCFIDFSVKGNIKNQKSLSWVEIHVVANYALTNFPKYLI